MDLPYLVKTLDSENGLQYCEKSIIFNSRHHNTPEDSVFSNITVRIFMVALCTLIIFNSLFVQIMHT